MFKSFFLLNFILLCTILQGKENFTEEEEYTFQCDITFPEATAGNVNTIYIPFTLLGRLMIVEAKVDTFIGNFIVDTGSERLILNSNYIQAPVALPLVTSVSNTGILQANEQYIDSLQIDQLTIKGLLAHIVSLDHIELKKNTRILGVLGYNVFQSFEVFIDFPNNRIVLSRVDKKGVRLDSIAFYEKPVDSLSFVMKRHLITIETHVNGAKFDAILDSGAELNLIDRRVNRKVLEKFSIIKRVNLIGVGKKQVEVLAGNLLDVKCGNQICPSMNTLLTSLDEMNAELGINVQGVLGYEFLSQRRTLINYQKRKLYFFGPLRS